MKLYLNFFYWSKNVRIGQLKIFFRKQGSLFYHRRVAKPSGQGIIRVVVAILSVRKLPKVQLNLPVFGLLPNLVQFKTVSEKVWPRGADNAMPATPPLRPQAGGTPPKKDIKQVQALTSFLHN